jgi:glycosyltransferase involved in cell wall biosynthesis
MTIRETGAPMRLLLIAYEFPPSPSPQSLRWAYLGRELHRLGHEVHVLTIDLGGSSPGLPALPEGMVVHRTYPGHLRGLIAWRRRWRERRFQAPPATTQGAAGQASPRPSRSGWKHRLSERLQRMGEYLWFPDLRGEWHDHALARMERLLAGYRPDIVISSHEPATTLQLGLRARRAGFKWVADLADPVLAPYTLPRWRERARQLEADVCNNADGILVTTPSARGLLIERHARIAPVVVLTQGFDDSEVPAERKVSTTPEILELLYTGSFYSFRTADALLQAVIDTPGTRLNIATIQAPDRIIEASQRYPDRIRLLGFLPHLQALRWQRNADVLVNLANRDPTQVPGKCYEYMGAGRPILHLGIDPRDAVAAQVGERRRGWVCAPDVEAITAQLQRLARLHAQGNLTEGLQLDRTGVAEFGWSQLARRLDGMLGDVQRRAPPTASR